MTPPTRSSRTGRWRVGVLAVASGLVLVACSGGEPGGQRATEATSPEPVPTATPADTAQPDQSEQPEPAAQPEEPADAAPATVTVQASDNFFDPSTLQGEAGQTVTVQIRNVGQVQHTFTVDSQGVDTVLDPGEQATVQVTVSGGSTPFKCRFHSGFGMTGTLQG